MFNVDTTKRVDTVLVNAGVSLIFGARKSVRTCDFEMVFKCKWGLDSIGKRAEILKIKGHGATFYVIGGLSGDADEGV